MRKLLVLAVGLACVLPCLAQQAAETSASTQEVFAPFVSRLKARASEQQVILTWKPSPDVEGSCLIYRSPTEIDADTFGGAEFVARVGSDAESYTDSPPYDVEHFYAVLIEDTTGKLYSVFIPFRNKTTSPVVLQAPAAEESVAAVVTGLKAVVQGETVGLSFRSTRDDRELMVFRSTRPLEVVNDLLEAVSPVVLDPGLTTCTDRPIAGVEYYYAVVDLGLLQAGKVTIVRGQNSLDSPVAVGLAARTIVEPPARARPLPRLLIPTGVEFGEELIPSPPFLLPRAREIGPATVKAVAAVTATCPKPVLPQMERTVLDAEKAAQQTGAETGLSEIIGSYFLSGKDTDTRQLLEDYLRIERSPDVEARARFYLGQIDYFAGDFRGAFMNLLLSQDSYYAQTQPWLAACLSRLAEQD